MRRIEDEQVEVPMRATEQADWSAKKMRHMEELLRFWKRLDDIGISGHQGPRFDVVRSQHVGSAPTTSARPPVLMIG